MTETMMRDRPTRGGASSSSSSNNNNNVGHNFTTLPTWGFRKQLVCVKDPSPGRDSPTRSELGCRKRRSSSCDGDGDGGDDKCEIEVVREKLMHDLCKEVNQMQASLFKGGKHSPAAEVLPATADTVPGAAADAEGRPWNLRTRRAVCKDPNNINNGVPDGKQSVSPVKSMGRSDRGEEKRPRAKFSVSLSKQEIEEDFLGMTGNRPARRPKKRNKNVQRQIDALFPGFWLSEITADMYKVNEQQPDGGKR